MAARRDPAKINRQLLAVQECKRNLKNDLLSRGLVGAEKATLRGLVDTVRTKVKMPNPAAWQRPTDWIDRPVLDGTIDVVYLLVPVFDTQDSILHFYVLCKTSSYPVKVTVLNGVDNPEEVLPSGAGWPLIVVDHTKVNEATRCVRGYKQVWVKIETVRGNLQQIDLSNRPSNQWYSKLTQNYPQPVIEVYGDVVEADIAIRPTTSAVGALCYLLEAYEMKGKIKFVGPRFPYAYGLKSVKIENLWQFVNAQDAFNGCPGLVYLDINFLTDGAINFQPTNCNQMFLSSFGLTTLGPIDTSMATNVTSMFANCYNLREIKGVLDFSKIGTQYNMSNVFQYCYSLSIVDFVENTIGYSIDFKDNQLTRQSILNVFRGLKTVTTAQTVTITNCPGAAELTAEDKAIATAKGWTIIG